MNTLWPRQFVDMCVDLLARANHPAIATVHTCTNAGLKTPPCGVVVTLNDGWRLTTQTVRGSGPGGDAPPEANYQALAVGVVLPPTAGTATTPTIKTRRLLDGLRTLLLAAGHDAVRSTEVTATAVYAVNRPHLLVACHDGATLHTTVVAITPPGRALETAPLHQVPADMM